MTTSVRQGEVLGQRFLAGGKNQGGTAPMEKTKKKKQKNCLMFLEKNITRSH